MTKPPSEFSQLIERVRSGSQEAAWELVAQHGDLVLRSIRKRLPDDLRRAFDSDDFVQVIWMTIFHHASRVGRIKSQDEFVRFLATVAANKVGMEVRKRLIQQKHNVNRERGYDSTIAALPGNHATPSQYAVARERWFNLIANKSPRQQEVIRLRYEGHTMQQIADRVDLHEDSVRRILRTVFQEAMT